MGPDIESRNDLRLRLAWELTRMSDFNHFLGKGNAEFY
jgi:hypothetical protein